MDMPKHIQGRATHQMGKSVCPPGFQFSWVCQRLASAAFQLLQGARAPGCKLRLAGYPSAKQTDLILSTHKVL